MSTGDPLRPFRPHDSARPESLAGIPLASFRARLAAYVIDLFVVFATYLPAVALLHYILFARLHLTEDIYHSSHVQVRFEFERLTHTMWIAWLLFYFGLSVWRTNGFTLGKRLCRIRVVSLAHERITLWQAIERALGYGASMLEAGFGFFQYFLHPNHCCVHDRIAETIVVKHQKQAAGKNLGRTTALTQEPTHELAGAASGKSL